MTLIVIPADARDYISQAAARGGELRATRSTTDDIFVITGVEVGPDNWRHPKAPRTYSALRQPEGHQTAGQWLGNVPCGTNVLHYNLRNRPGAQYTFDGFSDSVPLVRDPRDGALLLITHEPDIPDEWREAGVAEYAGWHVTRERVIPVDLAIEPTEIGVQRLDPQWPVRSLATMRVGVVGVGSIGGVVADNLAGYGIGALDLIDPDWFLWHNQIRHVLGPESVGRRKVDAMHAHLGYRWPETVVHRHLEDVAVQAHLMRPLFRDLDAVVCAADGIAARRVVSHLASRAGIPAVLACVLEDGAVGEILRLRPGARYGCLLCHRAALAAADGMDVEVLQERDYGTGNPHRPMTAVGPDLWLVGNLAAKATVATLLESRFGDLSHRLPGDHAVIGLRPSADRAQEPFDVVHAEQIQWGDVPAPRETCPTCTAA
ncbi:ThiF family adenylyltransferase [Nocardioides sp. Root190]|uniref:ThiF family adenylyltransferase n=1 Tax=Nocardioides sp. Root190 TaxID=1736488 RepID=UPI000AC9025E|nr:ThiF family adenylyltransferase [Nocardioides sp. Root190]